MKFNFYEDAEEEFFAAIEYYEERQPGLGLHFSQEVYAGTPDKSDNRDNWYVLTADGADRIGFVATVTKFCKDQGINILDLTTTQSDGRYVMILYVDLGGSPSAHFLVPKLELGNQIVRKVSTGK